MAGNIQPDSDKDYVRLHVGGLASDVTDKDLRDRFGSFGKITSIDVIKGYDCACRGFAYINFDKSADIKKCISVLDRTRWRGNVITIKKANADYLVRRAAEMETRQKREQEFKEQKESKATLEENAASKDKAGLWVVNKHGSVLPVLRIVNNSGKIIKVNPNKFKNAVKRLAADSSGEEEQNWGYDEVGEAPKKISEDIEIINEDQMEIDEEVAGSKTDIAYPFSDDEYDEKYESRDEDDSVPIVPANVRKEKKSALSILEQMFPEEKDFIRKKDAKVEKTRAVEMKDTVPVGPGVKEALKKIEAKKATGKVIASTQVKQVAKPEAIKEINVKIPEKIPTSDLVKEVKANSATDNKPEPSVNTKKRSREESSSSSSEEEGNDNDSSSTTSSASSSTEFFENIKRRKIMEQNTRNEQQQKVAEKRKPKQDTETNVETKPATQEKSTLKSKPAIEGEIKATEKSADLDSSSDEESDSDSSSTTSSASSSTEFFENIKRRKMMEQKAKEEKQGSKDKNKQKQALDTKLVVEPAKVSNKVEIKKDQVVASVAQETPAASSETQGLQVDAENGQSWVDIMNQYETERLKPVTILAPKAVWKLFPDRDDSTTTTAPTATTTSDAMEFESTTTNKNDDEDNVGIDSKDYEPFFPFVGDGGKLIGDTLVRTKTLEEIEGEWRREKVFLTQDYKKKQSIAVKKRRKLEKKQR